ncbi:cupredoxin domain-containing protein [Paenibacillus caui]|uniref:cupredoxin domain-containing protein n=1 Tax=Paenibacillus caui TaxID=2873927 RepID=UPI001CA7DA99|nr:cupredoxin domain-containing protein [Paenibacillus caui]
MKKSWFVLVATLSLFAITACSNSGKSGDSGPAAGSGIIAEQQLHIEAVNYKFDQEVYHVKLGVPVEIILDNKKGNHGLIIKELGVNLDQAHKSAVVIPDQAGEYEISCSIPCGPGHKTMKAKLIVE